jgi:hypothetical protein
MLHLRGSPSASDLGRSAPGTAPADRVGGAGASPAACASGTQAPSAEPREPCGQATATPTERAPLVADARARVAGTPDPTDPDASVAAARLRASVTAGACDRALRCDRGSHDRPTHPHLDGASRADGQAFGTGACAHAASSVAYVPCSGSSGWAARSMPTEHDDGACRRVHPELSLPTDDEDDEPAPCMDDEPLPSPPSSPPPNSDSEMSDESESESESGIARAIMRASAGSAHPTTQEVPLVSTPRCRLRSPSPTVTAAASGPATVSIPDVPCGPSGETAGPAPPPPPPPPPPNKRGGCGQSAGQAEGDPKSAQLRPLYWRTCSFDNAASAQSTVWACLGCDLSPTERELIASEFCLSRGQAESIVVPAERLSVLDAKRSNAVSFLLAKLPELPALAQAIYEMDAVLDSDRLAAMVRLWPTALEIDAIERHEGSGVRPAVRVSLDPSGPRRSDAFACGTRESPPIGGDSVPPCAGGRVAR